MNKKMIERTKRIGLLFCIMFFLVSTSFVFGFAISPSTTNVQFKQGLEKEIVLNIHNVDMKEMALAVTVSGELKDYVSYSSVPVEFTSQDSVKQFRINLSLPDDMDKPGLSSVEVNFQDINSVQGKGEVNIVAKTVLVHQIFVHTPYPGKYASASMRIRNVQKGEPVPVYIKIMNLGEEDIKDVSAKISLRELGGKFVKGFEVDSRSVESRKVGELFTYIDSSELLAGDYVADVMVNYDGNLINLSTKFLIDDFLLELVSISVSDFKLGDIARFSILLKNIGNRLVSDASSYLLFKSQEGGILADSSSLDVELKPAVIGETVPYWDTGNINVGDYEGSITLMYEDKSLEQNIRTIVEEESLEVEVTPVTGFAVNEELPASVGAGDDKTMFNALLFIIIILLIIIALILFFRLKKDK